MKKRPIFYSLLPLLILATIVIGLYLGRDALKQHLLAFVTERLELSNLDVQGLQVDANGMRAQSIHFRRDDGQQDLNLTLEDVKLGFSVLPLDLSSLVVGRGMLDVAVVSEKRTETVSPVVSNRPSAGRQTGSSTTVTTTGSPARLPARLLDLESILINKLSARVELPENAETIGFVGSARWSSDGDQVAVALENDLERITINSDASLETIAMQIEHPMDAPTPTRLSVTGPFTSKPDFEMTAKLANVQNWVATSQLAPTQLRDAVEQLNQSIGGFTITGADVRLTGGLDVEADWQLRPLLIQLNGNGEGPGDCRFHGNVAGTLSTKDSVSGTFAIEDRGTISAFDCVAQNGERFASNVNVIPYPGLTIAYDLTTANDPAIDVIGSVELGLELPNRSATIKADDLRITDAWNEGGLPGTANGTITTVIHLREFAQTFSETTVNATGVEVEGTFELSQSSTGAPYELSSDNLRLNIEQVESSQRTTKVEARDIEGSVKTTLQLTPSVAQSVKEPVEVNGVIDLSTDMVARDINLRGGDDATTINIDNLRLSGQAKGDIDSGRPSIVASLDYGTSDLSLNDPAVSVETATGNARVQFSDTIEIDTTLSIANISGAAPLPPLPIQQLEGSLKTNGDSIDGSGTATLATDLEVPWTLRKHQQRTVVSTSIIANVATLYDWLVPALGDDLTQSVSITDGRVRMDSELEIDNNNRSMIATATMNNVSGGFEDVKFSQASVTMNAADLLSQLIDLKVEVADGEFANGTTFSDLSSDVRIAGSKVTIDQFATKSFDAGFFFSNLVIGDQNTTPATVITVDGLDLSVVTSELAKEQISATGEMSGEIPFRITENSIAIDNGRLESDGTGTIAYRSAGSEQNIEGLNNIALQALENFHYDKVELNLDYTEQGEYLAKFKLSGNNPELYDGYPVVLNLNINGQLPGLLRSSLIGGNFNEEILRTLPQNPTQTEY